MMNSFVLFFLNQTLMNFFDIKVNILALHLELAPSTYLADMSHCRPE